MPKKYSLKRIRPKISFSCPLLSAILLGMNKLNIPEPKNQARALNIVEIDLEDPQEEAKCIVCGNKYYEWGYRGLMLSITNQACPQVYLQEKIIFVSDAAMCNNFNFFMPVFPTKKVFSFSHHSPFLLLIGGTGFFYSPSQ